MSGVDAYPLQWPTGRPRTLRPQRSRFARSRGRFDFRREFTRAQARDEVLAELARLKAASIVISTNVPVKRDGHLSATGREPDDPGVAVYFMWKGKQKCFACDRYNLLRDNLHAIALTIAALRGIDRWGTGDMVEAAFAGFDALPAPGSASDPWSILGVSRGATADEIKAAYRNKIAEAHPDRGGSDAQAAEVNAAYTEAIRRTI